MTYYGIVDKIKDEHKNGVYGRRELTAEEIKTAKNKYNHLIASIGTTGGIFFAAPIILMAPILAVGISAFNLLTKKKKTNFITRQYGNDNSSQKGIIIENELLNDDYEIDGDEELFYGLFDNFLSEENAFRKIMKSKGGSTLIIIERNSIPKKMHFGGEFGRFNCGLYCSHPKDENLLIPLENSNELIKTLILEETLSAYEALGAKKIIIEDKTNINTNGKADTLKAKGSFDQKYGKQILREKLFGKGTFDKDRALKDSLFIHDFPNITTTLKGRINGNQTSEKFTENINLSVGLDLEVLKLFKGNINFEYNRNWYFEVEFYDKNE
ncbi:hypothetical protein [Flavobacterium ovatum]|uniref:hypothetical protein n=1 Tax=Flavobacterium ovatum TaxID=1928857 RepID=UPI00344E37B7